MVLWAGPDWSQRSISEGPASAQQQKKNKQINIISNFKRLIDQVYLYIISQSVLIIYFSPHLIFNLSSSTFILSGSLSSILGLHIS